MKTTQEVHTCFHQGSSFVEFGTKYIGSESSLSSQLNKHTKLKHNNIYFPQLNIEGIYSPESADDRSDENLLVILPTVQDSEITLL